MELSVSQLAERSGLSVDTVRYYQTIGLLPAPRHEGRKAVYEDAHLERLERVRELADRGFSLKAIRAVLDEGDEAAVADKFLRSAIEESSIEARYSAADLARELDIPKAILASIDKAGLADDGVGATGSKKFSKADLDVARGAIRLLRYGFPITKLITLAVRHDRAVRKAVDDAIDLFDDNVRKAGGTEQDPEAVAEAFRELMPVATALVAHHFQRVLISRALKRLKQSGEKRALQTAVRETKRARFGLRWK